MKLVSKLNTIAELELIQNYSDSEQELTMSPLPSTTLNTVKIEINEHLTIIDTPGLVDNGSILSHCDQKLVKKISPKKEIKPVSFQIYSNQSIYFGGLGRMDIQVNKRVSATFYMSDFITITITITAKNITVLSNEERVFSIK